MIIHELHIKLDLQPENKIDVLKDVARECNEGYLFIDSSDGHCYLFDENGNEDESKKLKKIDNNTFYKCESLTSIVIPDSVESIGNGAFGHCKNLKSLVIPDSVKSIGTQTFWHCESLTSIVIPDSVESIGDWAFFGCESLKSLVIPDSVKYIGYDAFYNCKSLKSLSFKGKTLNQVELMEPYPFGIEDESIIKCI